MADKDGPGFEGPEKKFEIDFRRKAGREEGLFAVSDELWQKLLDLAHCTIIGTHKSENCRMYVLSESSLFVYRRRLIIKTCGITTLISMVPALLKVAGAERNDWNATLPEPLGLEVEYASFSRKNFIWPERQPDCHASFERETKILEELFPGGGGYILGPINKEHWNFFVVDYTKSEDRTENPPDQTLEVIMSDLCPQKMRQFFNEDGKKTAEEVTKGSGIDTIIPGSAIDAKIFEPCGYSMNGLTEDDHYWTIHITPEDHCSFVSFETNLPQKDYHEIVQRVIEVFRPGKLFLTLFADNHSISNSPVSFGTAAPSPLPKNVEEFRLAHKTTYEFGEPFTLTMHDFKKVV